MKENTQLQGKENRPMPKTALQISSENPPKITPQISSETSPKITPQKADVILLIVAVIWGGGFIAGKVALETASPQWILFVRFGIAALVIGLLFFKTIKTSGISCMRWGFTLGFIQFVALFIQLFALQYTTTAKQSFLAATYVLFTPFIARLLLRKKITRFDYIASVLALAGVALLSLRGSQEIQIGDFITLGFSIAFSVEIVLIGKVSQDHEIIPLTFYQVLGTAIFSGLAVLFTGLPDGGVSTRSALGMLYLGILNTAVAFGLQNFAQRYTSESHAALILSLESVFGLAFSVLFYHEVITIQMGIGCGLIFIALLVSNHR